MKTIHGCSNEREEKMNAFKLMIFFINTKYRYYYVSIGISLFVAKVTRLIEY